MTHKEKLIAYLEEEIRLLKDNEPFIDNRYRNFPLTRIQLGVIQTQLADLNEKVNALSEKKSCCVLSEDDDKVLKMLVGRKDNLQQDRQELSDWLITGIKKITIIDPYFFDWFSNSKNIKLRFTTPNDYADFLANLIPVSVKDLDIFHHPKNINKNVKSRFIATLKSRNLDITANRIETTDIHDRLIINHDNLTAKLVGSSLNQYGGKLSFILDLPATDLNDFLPELLRIKSSKKSLIQQM